MDFTYFIHFLYKVTSSLVSSVWTTFPSIIASQLQCCQNIGSLYPDAKMRYGDRVLEEKERVALIFARQRGEHSRLAPQELCPLPGKQGEVLQWSGVCNKDQGSNSLAFLFLLKSFEMVGLLTRLQCVQGLGWSFSGPFNLASGGFLAAPPLISNCS